MKKTYIVLITASCFLFLFFIYSSLRNKDKVFEIEFGVEIEFSNEKGTKEESCENHIITWEENEGFHKETEDLIICNYEIDENGCCVCTYDKKHFLSGKITRKKRKICRDFEIEDYSPR